MSEGGGEVNYTTNVLLLSNRETDDINGPKFRRLNKQSFKQNQHPKEKSEQIQQGRLQRCLCLTHPYSVLRLYPPPLSLSFLLPPLSDQG